MSKICIEDYRIARKSGVTVQSVAVSTSSIELVPQCLYRMSLVIGCPVANRITISTDPGVTDQNGIVLTAGGSPLVLSLTAHGEVVTQRLFAISNTATNTIGTLQTILPPEVK